MNRLGGPLQLGGSHREGAPSIARGGKDGAQLRPPCAAGLVVNVVPSDDIGPPRGHGGANGEGETLVKRLAEQGQHLVALGAVREVGHPSSARIPNSWVWVFSLGEWGGRMSSCAS